MDFRQLEVFVAVVDLSSFSKAGEKLYLSQPTVSAHIIALEKELDVPLIIRNTREIYPSEEGQKLYDYAIRLLRLRDEALEQICAHGQTLHGVIDIAASTIPAKHLLPGLISGFRESNPGITFNIIPCDSSRVGNMLAEGKAKIGFSGAVINSELCRHYPIAKDQLVLITPNNQRFQQIISGKDAFDKQMKEPFIMRPVGSGTRYEFEQYLQQRKYNEPINIAAEMADTEAIKNSVEAGMGVAVISERAAEDAVRFGLLLSYPLPEGGERSLYLINRKKDRLSERERIFCSYVLSHANKL